MSSAMQLQIDDEWKGAAVMAAMESDDGWKYVEPAVEWLATGLTQRDAAEKYHVGRTSIRERKELLMKHKQSEEELENKADYIGRIISIMDLEEGKHYNIRGINGSPYLLTEGWNVVGEKILPDVSVSGNEYIIEIAKKFSWEEGTEYGVYDPGPKVLTEGWKSLYGIFRDILYELHGFNDDISATEIIDSVLHVDDIPTTKHRDRELYDELNGEWVSVYETLVDGRMKPADAIASIQYVREKGTQTELANKYGVNQVNISRNKNKVLRIVPDELLTPEEIVNKFNESFNRIRTRLGWKRGVHYELGDDPRNPLILQRGWEDLYEELLGYFKIPSEKRSHFLAESLGWSKGRQYELEDSEMKIKYLGWQSLRSALERNKPEIGSMLLDENSVSHVLLYAMLQWQTRKEGKDPIGDPTVVDVDELIRRDGVLFHTNESTEELVDDLCDRGFIEEVLFHENTLGHRLTDRGIWQVVTLGVPAGYDPR